MSSAQPRSQESSALPRTFLRLFGFATLVAFVAFRLNALLRVQGPLIADSTEYLLLAQNLLTGTDMPVQAVRNCLFPLLVSAVLGLRGLLPGAAFDADAARLLPLLFHVFALWGAYALGSRIGSRAAGILAALFIAVLPDFGYWGSDCLTDVPAAVFVVWSLVFWVRGKPLLSGLSLSLGVLLRYQTLFCLLAFLITTALLRRRRRLLRCLPALLLIPLGLALLDGIYWGEPFLSIQQHFSRFNEHFGRSLFLHSQYPAFGEPSTFEGPLGPLLLPLSKIVYSDLLLECPAVLSWTVLSAFLSFPLARRWLADRWAGDAAFGVCVLSFLALCAVADDDVRYLVALTPVVAALAAACALAWLQRLAALCPPRARQRLICTGLIAIATLFCATCWARQLDYRYRPFGALLDAVRSLESADRTVTIATRKPWVLAHEYGVTRFDDCDWITARGIRIAGLDCRVAPPDAEPPDADPREQQTPPSEQPRAFGLDYVLLERIDTDLSTETALWRRLNRVGSLREVFYDRSENLRPAWCFGLAPPHAGPRLFRAQVSDSAGDAPSLARYACGLSLLGVEARRCPGVPAAVRLDFLWRLEEAPARALRARVRTPIAGSPPGTPDSHDILPALWTEKPDALAAGSVLRLSRYRILPDPVEGRDLRVRVEVLRAREPDEGASFERQRVLPGEGPGSPEWWLEVAVPLQSAAPVAPLHEPE